MNRFRKTFVVIMAMFILLVSGCGSSSTPAEGNKGEKTGGNTGDKKEEVTIKLFSQHGQFRNGQYGYKKVEEFMKNNPHIKVEVTYANGSNWDDTFLALASSNELPDIIQPSGNFLIGDLVENNWVQPLDELFDIKDRFPNEVFVEGVNMLDGEIYSYPRISTKSGSIMLYHTDLMEEAGLDPTAPPKTWDELLEMSKQVTENVKGVYGFALPLKDGAGGQTLLLARTLQPTMDGAGFDYQKGEYDLDSPNVIQAVEFLLKMRDEGVIHPNSPTLGLLDYQGLYANKQAAFGFNGQWIVRVNEHELDGVEDYNVAEIPVSKEGDRLYQGVVSGASDAYLTSTTKHPEEAVELLKWLTSKEDYFVGQMKDDLLLPPHPDLIQDAGNYNSEPLKSLGQILEETVVYRPVYESNPGAFEAKNVEKTLPPPRLTLNDIVIGAYIDEMKDWKDELTKLNDALNERLGEAIKKTQEEGIEVSKEDFTFPDFDGKSNYKE